MKTRPLLHWTSAAMLAAGCSLVAAPTPPATAGESPPAQETPAKKTELEKGMSAEEIIGLIGKPDSVSPLKMATGKAEKWTYRKLVGQQVQQVATDVGSVPAFVGNGGPGNNDLGSAPEIKYTLKHISTYQVTALLMVNDHLLLARQWREKTVTYDQ